MKTEIYIANRGVTSRKMFTGVWTRIITDGSYFTGNNYCDNMSLISSVAHCAKFYALSMVHKPETDSL